MLEIFITENKEGNLLKVIIFILLYTLRWFGTGHTPVTHNRVTYLAPNVGPHSKKLEEYNYFIFQYKKFKEDAKVLSKLCLQYSLLSEAFTCYKSDCAEVYCKFWYHYLCSNKSIHCIVAFLILRIRFLLSIECFVRKFIGDIAIYLHIIVEYF